MSGEGEGDSVRGSMGPDDTAAPRVPSTLLSSPVRQEWVCKDTEHWVPCVRLLPEPQSGCL